MLKLIGFIFLFLSIVFLIAGLAIILQKAPVQQAVTTDANIYDRIAINEGERKSDTKAHRLGRERSYNSFEPQSDELVTGNVIEQGLSGKKGLFGRKTEKLPETGSLNKTDRLPSDTGSLNKTDRLPTGNDNPSNKTDRLPTGDLDKTDRLATGSLKTDKLATGSLNKTDRLEANPSKPVRQSQKSPSRPQNTDKTDRLPSSVMPSDEKTGRLDRGAEERTDRLTRQTKKASPEQKLSNYDPDRSTETVQPRRQKETVSFSVGDKTDRLTDRFDDEATGRLVRNEDKTDRLSRRGPAVPEDKTDRLTRANDFSKEDKTDRPTRTNEFPKEDKTDRLTRKEKKKKKTSSEQVLFTLPDDFSLDGPADNDIKISNEEEYQEEQYYSDPLGMPFFDDFEV